MPVRLSTLERQTLVATSVTSHTASQSRTAACYSYISWRGCIVNSIETSPQKLGTSQYRMSKQKVVGVVGTDRRGWLAGPAVNRRHGDRDGDDRAVMHDESAGGGSPFGDGRPLIHSVKWKLRLSHSIGGASRPGERRKPVGSMLVIV